MEGAADYKSQKSDKDHDLDRSGMVGADSPH